MYILWWLIRHCSKGYESDVSFIEEFQIIIDTIVLVLQAGN